ncbi:MAG TPA: iron chelate uptake ABC transporter family permease subunit, partial [Saprospiraceae bacterium]|nr:iron chelate uptake ABC transporter family permease subunit [Saprospiraceae bacterium]
MVEILEIIQSGWALRSMATAGIIGVTCGVLGTFIVLRNMSLIGDALSHAILPGIFVAYIIIGYSTIGFFLGSVIAGLITAILITWIQSKVNTKNDAAIGIVFTAMFSIGVIGISSLNHKQGVHIDLKDFLFGNVLGISNEDLILSLIVMAYVVTSVIFFYRYFFITTFQPTIATTMGIPTKRVHYFIMLILSFTVVVALRSVGVILVVAMLITPAATALLISDRLKRVIVLSGLIGLLSSLLGFLVAIIFDTTPGPAIVLTSTLFYLVAMFFAPKKGIILKWWNVRNEEIRILEEDIIKYLDKNKTIPTNIVDMGLKLGKSNSTIKSRIDNLQKKQWISKSSLNLTPNGELKAADLVRAHRLWESYQVESMGLDSQQVHEDAERLEHHLTEDFINELDQGLGFPNNDPHGSPIPQQAAGPCLLQASLQQHFTIVKEQDNDAIEAY